MVYRKTEATEERKEARRRLILDTAARLFGKHGYHATTVPMIVAEAEVSTGSFYMYFHNKEDLFNAALEELGVAIAKVFDDVMQTQPNALKRIPQGAEALFMFLAENPEQARLLLVESSGLSKRLDATRRAILSGQEENSERSLNQLQPCFPCPTRSWRRAASLEPPLKRSIAGSKKIQRPECQQRKWHDSRAI